MLLKLGMKIIWYLGMLKKEGIIIEGYDMFKYILAGQKTMFKTDITPYPTIDEEIEFRFERGGIPVNWIRSGWDRPDPKNEEDLESYFICAITMTSR